MSLAYQATSERPQMPASISRAYRCPATYGMFTVIAEATFPPGS